MTAVLRLCLYKQLQHPRTVQGFKWMRPGAFFRRGFDFSGTRGRVTNQRA
jgi:hypothetical protein